MKKLVMILAGMLTLSTLAAAQQGTYEEQLQAAVAELDKTADVAGYQKLESYFVRLAGANTADWLPWYYAAFCNAKIGLLYQQEGDRIEPFSQRGEKQIKKALSLLDTASQKKELAEVYVVMNRVYQSKVFINPMTYGPKFGPVAFRYQEMARQLDPENPRVIYLDAWMKYYAPKMYGGDKDKARELARLALEKLRAAPASGTAPHWGEKACMEILNK